MRRRELLPGGLLLASVPRALARTRRGARRPFSKPDAPASEPDRAPFGFAPRPPGGRGLPPGPGGRRRLGRGDGSLDRPGPRRRQPAGGAGPGLYTLLGVQGRRGHRGPVGRHRYARDDVQCNGAAGPGPSRPHHRARLDFSCNPTSNGSAASWLRADPARAHGSAAGGASWINVTGESVGVAGLRAADRCPTCLATTGSATRRSSCP